MRIRPTPEGKQGKEVATFILTFNAVVMILFTICYSYQLLYIPLVFIRKPKQIEATKLHRYAVVIAGRNESAVIGQLVDSLNEQHYPSNLLDTYVVADNCTDNTAEVAREHGAYVFERFDTVKKGKSWALDYAFKKLMWDPEFADKNYEGFFVFDADNVVDPDFTLEMNKQFDNGARIVTSFRNSKNYDSSWISAGSSLWYLREGKYLSQAREVLKNGSCLISGTGFLVSREVVEEEGGWCHHLLTEDIEFSIDHIMHGDRIAFAPKAMVYDEQPLTLTQSWNQRMRWARGFYQVLIRYGAGLFKSIGTRGFASFDALMTIAPAMVLSILSVVVNGICLLYGFLDLSLTDTIVMATTSSMFFTVFNFYLLFFTFAALTTFTEWDKIHAPKKNKIKYMFTFPIFMFTYLPIAIIAMFKKVEWKPIAHTVVRNTEDIMTNGGTLEA